jgi:hypothetical protein
VKKRWRSSSSSRNAPISMSKPRGTLKYTVGITLFRLASEVANRPGAGLPPSMYSVPPLRSTMLKL